MFDLRTTDEITNILNKFLEPFEATAFAGTDFSYFYIDSSIEYTFVISERMDRLFMEYAKSIGLKTKIDIFLLSFLHELGHHETLDEIDDDDEEYSRLIKENLNSDNDDNCKIYFALPDEKMATEWAINYINNNMDAIKNLWDQLQPAIMKFYAVNNIY